ncbi:MAG TPA: cupin domain-containing protein [Polyangia bacterium]|nr:cupin domain-containing protein [Polyangia bacterium]
MSEQHRNLVHAGDLPWMEIAHGERFAVKGKRLGAAAGGKKLGCSLYEQPPGKRAFQYHAHLSNEEAIYVLEGEGTLRLGGRELPLRAGDYVAFPVGEENAHQIINTSSGVLRYLCLSTMLEPEVVKYPDTDKLAVMAGAPPTAGFRAVFRLGGEPVGYWDGEK